MATKKDEKPAAKKPAAKAAAKPATVIVKKEKAPREPKAPAFYGTGRRKDASARVWVRPGKGKITVNGRDVETYFARPVLRMIINQPFTAIDRVGMFDVNCTVEGGGLSGQAGAVRLGISRALDTFDESFHVALRKGGFLTRDSRAVERKKYGRKKARRRFQFSKR